MRGTKGTTIPLNCVDKALFALHCKHEPMVNHGIMTIDGAVDPVRLKSALETVMLRHPILRSTISTGWLHQVRKAQEIDGRKILNVASLVGRQMERDTSPEEIAALYERRLSEWVSSPLDPTTEWPCRVLMMTRALKESSLVFTLHHSATDGLGLFRFMREVIGEYNGATDSSTLSTVPPTNGTGDEPLTLPRARRLEVRHFYLKMVASLVQRFLIAPLSPNARVCCTRSGRLSELSERNFCQASLNPYEMSQIKSRSRLVGATVNDILLASCFRAVEQWNTVCGKRSRKISIMVPVDIGTGTSSPIRGNHVSFISVSTTQRDRSDPDELLRTVHKKTSYMLKNRVAFSIVYLLSFCTCLPPLFPKLVARFLIATRVYLDSALLTNLGLIWPKETTPMEEVRMGNAKITGVLGLPPVVSPMGLSLCVGTYNGHLDVALVYRTSHFSRSDARVLLNLYLHEIRSYQRTPEGQLAPEVTQRETGVSAPV